MCNKIYNNIQYITKLQCAYNTVNVNQTTLCTEFCYMVIIYVTLVYFHIEVIEVILLMARFSFNAEVEGLADIKLSRESSSVDVSTLLCCLASSILVEWSECELEHRRNFSSIAD